MRYDPRLIVLMWPATPIIAALLITTLTAILLPTRLGIFLTVLTWTLLPTLAARLIPVGLTFYNTVLVPIGLMLTRRRGRQIAARSMPVIVMVATIMTTRVVAVTVVPIMAWCHIHRLARHMVIAGRIMAVIAAMTITTAAVYRTTGQGQPQQRDNHGFKQHAGLRTASG